MKKLLEQAIRFVGLSGIGWLMDFTVYTVLSFITNNPFINNIFSSCVGSTFVFCFSTRLVFKNNSKIPLTAKYCIYIIYEVLLILLASRILAWINGVILMYFSWDLIIRFAPLISKILVTPVTMVLNFFVMKGIIEKL